LIDLFSYFPIEKKNFLTKSFNGEKKLKRKNQKQIKKIEKQTEQAS